MSYHTKHIPHKTSLGFNKVIKFVVEDFCIDIFFYFGKSIKQKNALHSYAKFSDQ